MRGKSAFVTGGSSGIGLAAAVQLAQSHASVALFARDPRRLAAAARAIEGVVPACRVLCCPVDVADRIALEHAISRAVAEIGPPDRLVTSAGMVDLGEVEQITADTHQRIMQVNYFGTLWTIRAVLPHLTEGARIGIVGSAAGIIGVTGYAAYAPSKFALRGLADILRVELGLRGIGVTLCLPPDTETPMLDWERGHRNPVTAQMAAGARVMTAPAVARALLRGMEQDRALVLPNLMVRLMWWLAPLLQPLLHWQQRRLLRRVPPSPQMFPHDMDEHRQDAPDQKADRRDQ